MNTALIAALAAAASVAASQPSDNSREPALKVIATTDVHGNFFPYNFITRSPWGGSLARVNAYVDSVRNEIGHDRVVLLDNGDILQGQPTVYYYNFVDTVTDHIVPRIFSFMGYDAATIGNHDVETGHEVYDRWIEACRPFTPVLGANVIDSRTGEPYLKPYTIIERAGIRLAVLGLITPAIPAWLPENIWEGLRFEDMEASASRWMEHIRREENPDIVIGLFHSGADTSHNATGFKENAAIEVARRVDGFDAVIFGHDHRLYDSTLLNDAGHPVKVINPAANAGAVACLDVRIGRNAGGSTGRPTVTGSVVRLDNVTPSASFLNEFAPDYERIGHFVSRRLGESTGLFTTRDAFFGPSAFMDLLHRLQLRITGADISFAAPLSPDSNIQPGEVTMSDMFTLYKYENLLCVVRLTGGEVKRYLEMSYAGWCRTMKSKDDHMLLFADRDNPGDPLVLANPPYNFDSAAGIIYTVDLTRPAGDRVTILSMADGLPFDMERDYMVAINSYRANGGGNLLTDGAGIPHDMLKDRIVWSTERDLRYYLIELIEKAGKIEPTVTPNWRFVPDDYLENARKRDYGVLF